MARLSELFGRKGGEASADATRPLAAFTNANGNGGHVEAECLADVGVRLGEENEVLRNLLNDAGRKIGELDELKQIFNSLVPPFNEALRTLEQEKSQRLRLAAALDELRKAHESLRADFYEVEQSSARFEAEAEKLREELELARESNRALEGANLQLANELASGKRRSPPSRANSPRRPRSARPPPRPA